MKTMFTYILTNDQRTTLYVGVTNSLKRRVMEHREGRTEGFTKRYRLHVLVYYEVHGRPADAILREKQLKKLGRAEKVRLIGAMNPGWKDLFESI